MKKRSESELKKEMSGEELREISKKLAMEYASSPDNVTYRYFTRIYNIKPKTFYWLIYMAIVEDLVCDETVDRMQAKATRNSNARSRENAGYSSLVSLNNYINLRRQREIFKELRNCSKDKKVEIAEYFATHFEISQEDCAKQYGVKVFLVSHILEETILEGWIEEETYEKIKKRSIMNAKDVKATKNYFLKLTRKRNSNKKAVL